MLSIENAKCQRWDLQSGENTVVHWENMEMVAMYIMANHNWHRGGTQYFLNKPGIFMDI